MLLHIGPICNEQADHVVEAVLGALRYRRGYVRTLGLVFLARIHCGIAPRAHGSYKHISLQISVIFKLIAASNSTSSDL